MKKKLLVIMVILAMSASLLQGCKPSSPAQQDKSTTAAQTQTSDAPKMEDWQTMPEDSGGIALPIVQESAEYEFMLPENPSYPFQDSFIQVDELAKRTNVNLKISAKPQVSYETSISLAITSGSLPDIFAAGGDYMVDQGNNYGPDGMFLNVMQYIDDMPNFKKLLEDQPNMKQYFKNSKELYSIPIVLADENEYSTYNKYYFMIRTDILTKNGLSVPTTYDELYSVLTKLKSIYPDDYPWIMRGAGQLTTLLDSLTPSWNVPAGPTYTFFDKKTGKWQSMIETNEFRSLIEFVIKCYDNGKGVLDREFLLDTTQQWEEKLISGKGLFTIDWYTKTDWATQTARQNGNAEYSLEAMLPPGDKGDPVTFNVGVCKGFLSISSKVKDPHTLMKFIDYMYFSKAGTILANIGIEGKTFKMVGDNQWEYIPDPEFKTNSPTEFKKKYGLTMDQLVGARPARFGLKRHMAEKDQMTKEAELYKGHTIFPNPYLMLDDEDLDAQETLKEASSDVGKYIDTELSRFILGDRNMSEWDAFVKETKVKGMDQTIEIKNRAQEKMNVALSGK